ncbi:MAG: phosphatidate cytidylyltransferase [Gemmobacter sp.]
MTGGRFADLAPRMLSGGAMAAVGLVALWAGGVWFGLLIVVVTSAMVWELARMLGQPTGGALAATAPRVALGLAALAGGAVLATMVLPPGLALPLVFGPAIVGLRLMPAHRVLFAVYSSLMVIAGFGLWHLRMDFGEFGIVWMAWLALVVIVTDIAGYFAGRLIGGPKIWPRVSPKKTWSGTIAGWIGAAAVGAAFLPHAGIEILGISVGLSIAAQLGDVAESAVKRQMGVKDASNLIPGHGGVMDRFDGMLGASVLLLLVESVIGFPAVIAG